MRRIFSEIFRALDNTNRGNVFRQSGIRRLRLEGLPTAEVQNPTKGGIIGNLIRQSRKINRSLSESNHHAARQYGTEAVDDYSPEFVIEGFDVQTGLDNLNTASVSCIAGRK